METGKIIKLVIWFISFPILLGIGLEMVSKSNTIENIMGFFIIAAIIIISIKTKCLTINKFKKND